MAEDRLLTDKEAERVVWIQALLRGGMMISEPEQLHGISDRIRAEEREWIGNLLDDNLSWKVLGEIIEVLKRGERPDVSQ